MQSHLAAATLISSSNIQYCTNDGKDPLNCVRKLVVVLSVDANQIEDVEKVELLKIAKDETQGSSEQVSFHPIEVSISRTHVRYRYPLYYERIFNSKPYEKQIGTSFLTPCSDDFVESATCGLAKAKGKPIQYSQGFCCSCDVCQILNLCSPNIRSQRSCDLFGQFSTASCLRHNKHWYDGYSIGPYLIDYTIKIRLGKSVASTSLDVGSSLKQVNSTLLLTPQNPVVTSKKFGAIATVVGGLLPDTQPLSLTQSMFFAPTVGSKGDPIREGSAEWMILDKSLVTLNGLTCDKVGVSYEAFATQSNRCRKAYGSCLNFQLDDYRAMDKKAIASGRKGKCMAHSLGNFTLETFHNRKTSKTTRYLSYTATSSPSSVIVLTLSADDLRYILSVSPAIIMSANLTQNEVMDNSKDVDILVKIKNTGTVSSRFTVSIECSEVVFPIPAQIVSLKPSEVRELRFNLDVQDVSHTSTGTCEVILKNSEGHVQDKKKIEFKTKQRERNEWIPDDSSGSGRNETKSVPVSGEYNSSGLLKPLFTLLSYIKNTIKENIDGTIKFVFGWAVIIFIALLACSFLINSFNRRRTSNTTAAEILRPGFMH
ncbi:unnamed protein product [Phytomonas sp. Hart1]|nr:unnamed protein product [Phytomonas sp. Hart1]|eukprot:CCW68827.1 unnamed protein product [Phytomonas sp. isolate Hart1]